MTIFSGRCRVDREELVDTDAVDDARACDGRLTAAVVVVVWDVTAAEPASSVANVVDVDVDAVGAEAEEAADAKIESSKALPVPFAAAAPGPMLRMALSVTLRFSCGVCVGVSPCRAANKSLTDILEVFEGRVAARDSVRCGS